MTSALALCNLDSFETHRVSGAHERHRNCRWIREAIWQEIKKLFPILLETAIIIHRNIPSTVFLISCSNKDNLELINKLIKDHLSANRHKPLPIEVVTEKVSEIIKASSLCISSSGTIALEVAFYHVPMVICYRIARFHYFVAKPFMTTP